MRSKIAQRRTYLIMLLPCMIILVGIIIVPLVNLFRYSFYNYKLASPKGMTYIGIKNYQKVLKDKEFINSLVVTGKYVLGVLVTQVPVALLLIETLSSVKRGSGAIKTLIMPPMVVPGVVAAVIWRLLLNPSVGLVNYLLGIQQPWLADPKTTLISLIMVDFWQNTPFLILTLLAGRSTISDDLYEAGRIDGANGLRLFYHITLPLLRGSLMIGILFRIIDSLKGFAHINVMTSGGPGNVTTTINYYAYKTAFNYTYIGYSSALGVFMLAITVLLAIVLVRFFSTGGSKK